MSNRIPEFAVGGQPKSDLREGGTGLRTKAHVQNAARKQCPKEPHGSSIDERDLAACPFTPYHWKFLKMNQIQRSALRMEMYEREIL